ncbi:MAG: hypothetical protein JNJ46_30970, partial [Myxococcales bacterium]|nr:hypothetical protein [Myxococcales bacterium]
AKEAQEATERAAHAAEAVRELEAAVRSDSLLLREYGSALTEAQALVATSRAP